MPPVTKKARLGNSSFDSSRPTTTTTRPGLKKCVSASGLNTAGAAAPKPAVPTRPGARKRKLKLTQFYIDCMK